MTSTKTTRPNPYVGPRAFQTGEKIYGRDREVRELLDLLIAERIVLLHSPSGAGKSSLVQAGLIPALEGEGFQVLPVARVNLEPPAFHDSGSRFQPLRIQRLALAGRTPLVSGSNPHRKAGFHVPGGVPHPTTQR